MAMCKSPLPLRLYFYQILILPPAPHIPLSYTSHPRFSSLPLILFAPHVCLEVFSICTTKVSLLSSNVYHTLAEYIRSVFKDTTIFMFICYKAVKISFYGLISAQKLRFVASTQEDIRGTQMMSDHLDTFNLRIYVASMCIFSMTIYTQWSDLTIICKLQLSQMRNWCTFTSWCVIIADC